MKILIATGIFLPELGGPATYAPKIAKEWLKSGHQVEVLTYSDRYHYDLDKDFDFKITRIKRGNKVMNYWRYYQAAKKLAKKCDIIYAFDHFSAGLPSSIAAKKLAKPFYIRVGGDFIWERYLETHDNLVSIPRYYNDNLHLQFDKKRFKVIKKVFARAKGIIFTTSWQQNIFKKYYNLPADKLSIIPNALPDTKEGEQRQNINKDIICAVRIMKRSNLINLIDSFDKMKDKSFKLQIIGEGPYKSEVQKYIEKNNFDNIFLNNKISREELKEKFKTAYLVVFPSLSDISPNAMLECLTTNTPFISSQEIGFDWIKNKIKLFDPLQSAQITKHFDELSDNKKYQEYSEIIKNIDYSYNYNQAALDTLEIFNK